VIDGNDIWIDQLQQKKKRPLYYLEVPDFGLIITSFLPGDMSVGTGAGWGVMLWGEQPWGS
jgi:hypothetical protein